MGAKKKRISSFLNQAQEKISVHALAAPAHVPLRLKALNSDDLDIMAILLQDAILPATNFHYDKRQGTFTLKANRFCWETPHDRLNHQKVYQRVLACLQFQNITHVQHMNFKKGDPGAYYNLLTMTTSSTPSYKTGDPLMAQMVENEETQASHYIDLIFSHDARIRLHTTDFTALLLDSEETSYTNKQPAHTKQDVGNYIIANAIREHLHQGEA